MVNIASSVSAEASIGLCDILNGMQLSTVKTCQLMSDHVYVPAVNGESADKRLKVL